MSYVYTGNSRSLKVTVTKFVNGVPQTPVTYPTATDIANGFFTYTGGVVNLPTPEELAQMDESSYAALLIAFQTYVQEANPGLNFATATVTVGAVIEDDPNCPEPGTPVVPVTTTTTPAPEVTTTTTPEATTTTTPEPVTTTTTTGLIPLAADGPDANYESITECFTPTAYTFYLDMAGLIMAPGDILYTTNAFNSPVTGGWYFIVDTADTVRRVQVDVANGTILAVNSCT